MKITIIGSGYVGLVTGICLAEFGHSVTCVDTDEARIDDLQQEKCPIYEPELEDLLHRNIGKERLNFTTKLEACVADSEVIFIAVGTPTCRRGSGYADMNYVYEAARQIAPHLTPNSSPLTPYKVIVNKSTVPVGTARQVERIIKETNPNADFDIASNPEFLREGAAVRDFMHPDRVIIGTDSERAHEKLKNVYRPLYLLETPFVLTNPETAELTKYASNAFLATKISFINEIANLCEAVGADVHDVAKGMGLDGRIGSKFLHAGPGYGGSCFPKDTMALLRIAQEHSMHCRITETVVEVNHAQKARMVGKIRKALGGSESGKTIAILGLTFKPETDDMREAPSVTIIPALLNKGAHIRAHDPAGMEEARNVLPDIDYCDDPYQACENADAVCLLTEWNPYRALDLKRIKGLLKQPIFIDLRNVYSPETMREAGFHYYSVGRSPVRAQENSQ